jgi:hypothetical protein
MIQRIQTIYLIIAAVLLVLLFSNPVAEILISKELVLVFKFNRIMPLSVSDFRPVSAWPVEVLLFSILLVGISTIFLYKYRILQMRLCVLNIFLMFGLAGMIYFLTRITLKQWNGQESLFLWPIVIPFISIILTFLAFKAVQKDEKLVRSYDRIR